MRCSSSRLKRLAWWVASCPKKGDFLTSTEKNKALVRRFFEEVFNKGNLAVLDELLPDDYIQHSVFGIPSGREAVKQLFAAMGAAFPDAQYTIEDMVAEGDKVVVRGVVLGTHKGAFQGIPATGKQITMSGIDIFRIVDDKLVEHWDAVDQLGMLQQLGVVPAPGQG
ncbi:MAG: ester cyclase [Anaerolineales bacterium]